nr:uroporphyrinogen decarboxylase family protein [Candidatus Sigynarchaeota archaeon]
MPSNYDLLKSILDHEQPARVPSFHLGYGSATLERQIIEYQEPTDDQVCLYIDDGPAPRQATIDLTADRVLGYTGHYQGFGPVHNKSLGSFYMPDRDDLPFSRRFVKWSDAPDADTQMRQGKLWQVSEFGRCSARRAAAKQGEDGFSDYFVDGVLAPDTLDDWLASNAYTSHHDNLYKFLGRMTRDMRERHVDWSFPAIGGSGICDNTIMCLKGSYASFARYARVNPAFIDRVARMIFEALKDCVYIPLLEAGIPILYWGEDLGQKDRLLISPGHYERFFAKHLKEIGRLIHSYDARLIMHSDGNVSEIIPVLIDCGIDGLQALEPASGMKLGELARKYRDKLAFLGALDQRVLCWGTVDDTIAMVKRAIKEGKEAGGIFALGPSHQPIGARVENIFAMMAAIEKYGAAGR